MDYDIRFEPDKILQLSKSVMPQDALAHIENYNDKMTISQVVRFFERQGVDFTKTMIQNYVRVNALPPPVDKRYYTKDHLILLMLINNLKSVYSLDYIKQLMLPVLKNTNTFDDDMINMHALYDIYFKLYKSTSCNLETQLPIIIDTVKGMVNESGGVKSSEKETIYYFMTIMTLMSQSITAMQLAKVLIDNFNNNDKE